MVINRAKFLTAPVTTPAPEPPRVQTQYLREIYDPARARATLDWIRARLREYRADFDVVAFRGSSGAPALAAAILEDVPVLHVRKPSEKSHCDLRVEGFWAGPRVAIVDDLVETGNTIATIVTELADDAEDHELPAPKLTHVFLYKPSIVRTIAQDGVEYEYNCKVTIRERTET